MTASEQLAHPEQIPGYDVSTPLEPAISCVKDLSVAARPLLRAR